MAVRGRRGRCARTGGAGRGLGGSSPSGSGGSSRAGPPLRGRCLGGPPTRSLGGPPAKSLVGPPARSRACGGLGGRTAVGEGRTGGDLIPGGHTGNQQCKCLLKFVSSS